VKGELKMAVFGVVVNGAALESGSFQGELTVEGFGLFPALEEVFGLLVCVMDFEEEHLVDTGGLLEFLCGSLADFRELSFEGSCAVFGGVELLV